MRGRACLTNLNSEEVGKKVDDGKALGIVCRNSSRTFDLIPRDRLPEG